MAQWKGQFSGRTHATKVKRLERSLAVAVSALQAASKDEAQRKLKAARNIAERLLLARLHMMRSRISAAREKQQEESSVGTLRLREEAAQAGGVDAILREFGITSNIDDRPNKPLQPIAREDARSG
jgi:hypothetical protein